MGKSQFTYDQYLNTYNNFTEYVLNYHSDIPEFVESKETFLQFLYESNIICFVEDLDYSKFFRWCYRERSPANISPKVRPNTHYHIHYGLQKSLNVGGQQKKKY